MEKETDKEITIFLLRKKKHTKKSRKCKYLHWIKNIKKKEKKMEWRKYIMKKEKKIENGKDGKN